MTHPAACNPPIHTLEESNVHDFWHNYYRKVQTNQQKPSDFAIFVARQYLQAVDVDAVSEIGKSIVDLGCGLGRDSVFFANLGHNVLGVDLSASPIISNARLRFVQADMGALGSASSATELGCHDFKVDMIYLRFCLHSVNEDVQSGTLSWASRKLQSGSGFICIEVRSTKDALCGQGRQVGRNAYIASSAHSARHYRRFVVLDELANQLQAMHFDIVFSGEQCGWAICQDEDPVVIRVVAQRR